MYHYGNSSSMSRRVFHRYLIYYLTATVVLICGSSQRTPRRAICPSCSQDCPEALTSPWYPHRKFDLQDGILQDFSITPLKNSPYFRLAQREISQNIAHDDVLSSKNPISDRRYRSFSQQEPASEYLHTNRHPSTQFVDKSEQQNSFLGNFPNKFAEFSNKQTTLLLDKPVNNYPFARVSPSRQFFGEPEQENSFFRGLRNKYSTTSSDNVENHTNKGDPTRKFNVYRAGMKPSWENSKHISSNEIVPRKSFPIFHQTSILNEDEDEEEERNAIKRSLNSISQQYNLASPQDRYHSVGFDASKVQREPYVLPQDLDMQKPIKNSKVFDIKDSLEASSLGQLKSLPKNMFESYSVKEDEIITTKDDNEQFNYPYTSSPNSYIWAPTKDETIFPDNWDTATDNGFQNLIEINQFKKTENNWPQVYPAMEKNIRYFDEEEDKEYFEDEIEEDTTETGTFTYDPYSLLLNTDIWRTRRDEKLPDKLGFMNRRGLQGIQETKQPEIYLVKENNSNKYLQDEDKYTIQDETRFDNDRSIHAPVINVTPYIFPQSLLNIFNSSKYPTESSITDLPEMENNVLRANPIGRKHERLLKNNRVDDQRNQDQIFIKDTYDARKYNSLALDRKSDIKNNMQNKALAEIDSDLIDDVENPPTEPTESTPVESFEKRSTSTVKENS